MRQGDVLIVKVTKIPDNYKRAVDGRDPLHPYRAADGIVLAEGEVTGHRHLIHDGAATEPERGCRLYMADNAPIGGGYLEVLRECALTHEEHDPIPLEPGFYRVVRQRQWTSASPRPVAD